MNTIKLVSQDITIKTKIWYFINYYDVIIVSHNCSYSHFIHLNLSFEYSCNNNDAFTPIFPLIISGLLPTHTRKLSWIQPIN